MTRTGQMDESELRARLEVHHRESYGWALGCCRRDSAQAETVLQEAYLKILDGRARFDMRASFKTWLFSVIRKTASDQWRRRVLSRLRLTSHEESGNRIAQDASADESVYRSEIRMLFCRALESLPRRQREVLQLVFYHDLSLAEAAEAMGVSIGSARQHYDRGKRRLRQLMAGFGVFDETGPARAEDQRPLPTVEAG